MTALDDLPDLAPGRPVWLVTLADLALLLIGFFVLLQASQQLDRHAIAKGIREGFGVVVPADPIAVSADAESGFAAGSATLPAPPVALIDWAREASRDRRVVLRVTGAVDGTPTDVDALTHSGAVLAADRARAIAVALIAAGLPADRLTLATAARPGRRGGIVTMQFEGDRP